MNPTQSGESETASRCSPESGATVPPLLLLGGTVFTADPHDSMADAVAIKGDRIVSVGPVEEVRRLHHGGTELDLEGRLVLPGFIDAHNHLWSSIAKGA